MNQWGIDISVAIAGGLGGVFRYIIQPKRPWWEAFIAATVGVMLAVYLAPVVTPVSARWIETWFGASVEPAALLAAVGFLVGAAGRDVVERAIDLIRLYKRP